MKSGVIPPSAEAYICHTAAINAWKVSRLGFDIEDLEQEGRILYLDCCTLRDEGKSDAQFMQFFKTSFHNKIINLAYRANRRISSVAVSQIQKEGVDTDRVWEHIGGSEGEIASLMILISQAPKEIREALQFLFAEGGLERAKGLRKLRDKGNSNTWLATVLGRDPSIDIEGQIVAYLQSA